MIQKVYDVYVNKAFHCTVPANDVVLNAELEEIFEENPHANVELRVFVRYYKENKDE